MLTIKAIFVAKKGHEQELEAECRNMVAQVQAETGVAVYALHRAVDNPAKFFFYERYANQAVIDAHANTPHLQAFLKKLEKMTDGEPDIEIYEDVTAIVR